MKQKLTLTLLLLVLIQIPLYSQDALVLGGINRIKKANLNTNNYILIENDQFEIENGDIIKTKAKGYILIQKNGFQILIFPFSQLEIKDLDQNSFNLIEGKVWAENNKNQPNVVFAGSNQFRVNSGVSYFEYSINREAPQNESINAVCIKGQSNVITPGQNFVLSDYKKLSIKNKKTTFTMIPIEEVVSFVNSYNAYQGSISGWNNRQIEREKLLFKPAGGFSLLNSEQTNYAVLSLKPQFKYKDIQFGFIFPFYVNYENKEGYKPKNWGNYNEWSFSSFSDSLSDLVLKIDYFNYGEKYKTPVYFNAGNLDRLTLKNHLIISDFKPNLNYPQTRQLSFEAGFKTESISLDAVMANCASGEIFGFRTSYKPLANHYLFKKLEIGLTSVTDTDPQDVYGDHGPATIEFTGLDLNFPIYNFSEIMTFNFTSEFAKTFYIENNKSSSIKGFGYSYGLNGTVGDFLIYQGGGLILKDEYPDSYFDALYYSQRKSKLTTLLNSGNSNLYGVFGNIVFDLENIFKIELSYREVLDSKIVDQRPNNKFSFYFYLYPSIMDFAYIVISVDRVGIRNFSDYWDEFFSSNLTAINASLRLPFKLRYLELQLNYRRSIFIENNLTRTENSYESQIKFVF